MCAQQYKFICYSACRLSVKTLINSNIKNLNSNIKTVINSNIKNRYKFKSARVEKPLVVINLRGLSESCLHFPFKSYPKMSIAP